MPFEDESIGLIITSPPYANAIDYMHAHKFSLVWLGESIVDLSELRAEYIGSERVGKFQYGALPEKPEHIIHQLAERDKAKAGILRKYFIEIRSVLAEMQRVLRPDSAAVIVVGTSVMRGIDVQTHSCLADIADRLGFDVVGIAKRNLDRNKRMMPARFGKKSDSMIEQRMHEEYVIGLLKPESPRENEYDPARLNKMLDDTCVDGVVHVHKTAVADVCQLNGRLNRMMDLAEFVAATSSW